MHQPVAIVGMSCRFPGAARSPEAFWRLLLEGRDAVTEVGAGRFNRAQFLHPRKDASGKTYTFRAGVLPEVGHFDAGFFGVSPREAEQMDPQQRHLLELTWEALESAGLPAARLRGSDVAVYVGISATDYGSVRLDDPAGGDAYFMTGNSLSIAANRISHAFDFRGPSLAVDTACSSSLVAFHEAHRTVASGMAPMAVVGGVNMLLSPFPFVGFSRASMLSPEGKCRAFDARGQGYVRAEGGAVILLKPLAQAVADGDRILAVVRGAGANTDGYTRGIAMPSGEAQEALLRRTYEAAGVAPDEVSYFEAHGTGTPVGDPVEAGSIARALGMARSRDNPLHLGSVKTNIGHLEPASGLAGVVKSLLILEHGVIPPSLHFEEPNPNIDFEGWNLRVVTHPRELPVRGKRPLIGVNSFGFGGANAHVILEGFRPDRGARVAGATPGRSAPLPPLILSARGDDALRAYAHAMARRLEGVDESGYRDLAWSSAFRREWHPDRLLFSAPSSVEDIRTRLRTFAGGGRPQGVHRATVPTDGPQAWVFTGNGCQWAGMMKEWMDAAPGARAALARVDAALAPELGWSVVEYLERPAEEQEMARTEVAQPLLFAIQVAMVELLREAGVRPAAVLGHSVGEVAAAWTSGGMSLADACRVIVARSRMGARTAGMGGMAAAALSADAAHRWIRDAGVEREVEVAGVNSPSSVTLTGDREALDRLGEVAEERGVFFRVLDLDYPFHSRAMDAVEAPLLEALEGVNPGRGHTPFLSTVTGGALDPALLVSDYWWHNLRQPVRFADAVGAALEMGATHFLEIGPNGILGRYLKECAEAAEVAPVVHATGRRGSDEAAGWRSALDLAVLGRGPEILESAFPEGGSFVQLPAYPWQHRHFWYPLTPDAQAWVHGEADHPLLGTRRSTDPPVWENDLDPEVISWLADHVLEGTAIFPGAAFLEMALAAARIVAGDGSTPAVEGFEIRRPMVFPEGSSRTVEVRVEGEPGRITIRSRPRLSDDGWVEHVVATVAEAHRAPDLLPILSRTEGGAFHPAAHYRAAAEIGLDFGELFRTLTGGWATGESAEGMLAPPSRPRVASAMEGFHLPPPLIDGAFQLILQILLRRGGDTVRKGYVPVAVGSLRSGPAEGPPTQARAQLRRMGARSVVADFDLLDAAGEPVAFLRGCRFQQVARRRAREWFDDLLSWREVRVPSAGWGSGTPKAPGTEERVLLLAPPDGEAVASRLVGTEPGEVAWVVTHPDPEVLARLRAELPALPHLLVCPWDEPVPADRVETLGVLPDGVTLPDGWLRPVGMPPSRRWVVVAESVDAPELKTLEAQLHAAGHRAEVLILPRGRLFRGEDLGPLLAEHRDAQVWLLAPGLRPDVPGLSLTQGALRLARALHALTRAHPTQLCALTRLVEDDAEVAALPPLVRTLTNELEGVEFRVVEVAEDARAAWLDAWAAYPDELHLRVRGGEGGTPVVTTRRVLPGPALPPTEGAGVRLGTPTPGLLDALRWEEVPRASLSEGEVRIRVHATGLNFRDVMWAMGVLPDEAVEDGFAGATLGMECAGEVVETGPGCRELRPGDRVLAFAPASFAAEVVTPEGAVAPLPGDIGYAEAATIPATFFTAYYALHILARLHPGERVLIHGGAGGVGLAAIQWAKHVGAEIFATVGSAPKRKLMKELGVPHILNSRDLSFVDEVRARTGGEGVDVVLNSLAGEAMQASLDLLRPFGRFLELGKRDFYLNSRMAMRALRNNIAYHGIDADQLMAHRPAEARALFRELISHFEDGTLAPLPYRRYEADRVGEAFRAMQQARHMGKIVVTQDPPPRAPTPLALPFRCRPDATYLIVGGTGGFGFATARRLVEWGARHLVLASRRGKLTDEAARAVEAMVQEGVRIEVDAVDATEPAQVEALVEGITARGLPPLAGVIHAAMVLDDRRVVEMDPASVARVWHPKVTVAKNLDVATRPIPLDWTVYYSSATTFLGNPGQANYVAANGALEALAEARSRAGHPTLAVAWGAIEDAGYLVLNPHVKELLERRLGAEPLRAADALEALGQLLARGVTGVRAVLPMAWKRARRSLRVADDGAYRWLDGTAAHDAEERGDTDFHELAASMDPDELKALIVELLVEQLAGVLRLPQGEVDPERGLHELGLDSLMTVELGVGIERQFGVELPMAALADGVSLRRVADAILTRLRSEDGSPKESTSLSLSRAEALAARHAVEAGATAEERAQVFEELTEGMRESGGGLLK